MRMTNLPDPKTTGIIPECDVVTCVHTAAYDHPGGFVLCEYHARCEADGTENVRQWIRNGWAARPPTCEVNWCEAEPTASPSNDGHWVCYHHAQHSAFPEVGLRNVH